MAEGAVIPIMDRAIAALGRPCRKAPASKHNQRPRPDGWLDVGSIGELDRRQSYAVWWHQERHIGWILPHIMLQPTGLRPQFFDPRPHPRETPPATPFARLLWDEMDRRQIGPFRLARLLEESAGHIEAWLAGELPGPDEAASVAIRLGRRIGTHDQ